MMKIKYLGQSDFYKTYSHELKRIEMRGLSGYASIVKIEAVHRPLIIGKTRLLDDGYTVISFLPDNANWCLQAFYNEKGDTIEWYFDITLENKVDETGKPYYVDLYLDFVLLPNGKTFILDDDELKEALVQGEITQADYDLAYTTLNMLMEKFADTSYMALYCVELRQSFTSAL